MERNAEGFLVANVDQERCIRCGKCDGVCPAQGSAHVAAEMAYLLQSYDKQLRENSSSGGAFSMLAVDVISRGGVVFGCAMDEDCYGAHHIAVDNLTDLQKLRGSKYIQSDVGNSFAQAKQALDAGKWVLFSGTPCQIVGLRGFLGKKEYERLLCVDFICHGVASPWVWKKYLQELEQAYGSKAQRVNFRDKHIDWVNFSLSCAFANGEMYCRPVTEDPFLRGFVANLYLCNSCYRCECKGKGYASDITLADFWGVEQVVPQVADGRGTSLAIAHTKKGQDLLLSAQENGIVQQVQMDQALRKNRSYYTSVPMNPLRRQALRQLRKRSAHSVIEKFCGTSLMSKVRRKSASIFYGFLKR